MKEIEKLAEEAYPKPMQSGFINEQKWMDEARSNRIDGFIKGFIAGAKSQSMSDWVRVEDRLPEFGTKVLVLGEMARMNPSMGGAYIVISQRQDLKGTLLNKDRNNYQCENQFMSMAYVTHWMLLPSLPPPPQTSK